MGVRINESRKAVEITWLDEDTDENPLSGDHVDLRATNATDVSIRPGITNDGYAVVTYDADYHGESHIEVTDEDGEVAEGDIEV